MYQLFTDYYPQLSQKVTEYSNGQVFLKKESNLTTMMMIGSNSSNNSKSEAANLYSTGSATAIQDEGQWEQGMKEPGMRYALVSKDRRKRQRIYVPPVGPKVIIS